MAPYLDTQQLSVSLHFLALLHVGGGEESPPHHTNAIYSEVFYENRSATWQHPIIPRSFFFILLSMTDLSGALIVELFINILMTFFCFKDKAKERKKTYIPKIG